MLKFGRESKSFIFHSCQTIGRNYENTRGEQTKRQHEHTLISPTRRKIKTIVYDDDEKDTMGFFFREREHDTKAGCECCVHVVMIKSLLVDSKNMV